MYIYPCIYRNTDTYIYICILYSSFSLSIHLPVKLPTIALIDMEAAEEFLNNIVPGLYLEVPYNWEGISFGSASLLFIGHLFLINIDIFLYLCLAGWSIWKHMV
jgi:hypothetical protein